ncbi:MAG: hypothetical protein ABI877_16685 [Gemmatimonadaceae bacterium]
MSSFKSRHLPDIALLGAFLTVLSVALLRVHLSKDQTARALMAQRTEASLTDSLRSATANSLARARQDSINRAQPGYVIDSILPVEEELRRFRAVVGPRANAFAGGASSLDGLVRGVVGALERSDTVALSRLTLNAREFAWLVYPSSPFTKPPYRQAPGLVWMTIDTPSDAGRRKLLQRVAGQPLGLVGYRCEPKVERQGENRLHIGCVLELTKENSAISHTRLFGTIIERHGRFKIVSFDNDM